MIDRLKPPPANVARLSRSERRSISPDFLRHNQRLGWLLRLKDINPTLAKKAHRVSIETRIQYVREHLPDLFADLPPREITPYVANLDDQELI